jgi:taurine transport system substrate-binding protein
VVTNDFANRYPAIVTAWARAQDRAVKLIRSDPAKAAASVAAELDITPDEARSQLGDLIFLDAKEQVGQDYLAKGLADNLLASSDFNKSLGKIDAVQPEGDYRKAVVTTFAQGAAGS